ncbi:restriction endonuclease subunit S [Neisseria bacilliformis]|uniref:restriction endonuclease subunit S n=1 Tax=Neisseria bacilliformis TaxID=267212 RepID=UPI0028EFA77E|nr:restriction endonuclease subunit S [Neisseria bacilliformis]
MNTPQLADSLRAAVLQAAIKGELTERSSENARDLLLRIQNEKQTLQAKGSLKKTKAPAPVTADEVPFDIPENWVWVRLGDVILQNIGGGTPSKQEPSYWNGDIPWASVKDLNCDVLTKTIDSITAEGLENSSSNLIPKGTLIICTRMGLGKIALAEIDVAINQDLRAIFLPECLNKHYFYHFYRTLKMEGKGATVKGITVEELHNTPFPLPPLSEQQAIAEKLTRLLAEIDRLKAEEQSLASLQKAYPQTLRASVLAAAVRGDLNERSQEHARDLLLRIQNEKQALQAKGSLKKTKALPPVGANEVPFEIPENWVWVRLGDVTDYGIGKQTPSEKIPAGSLIVEMEDIEKETYRLLDKNRERTPKSSKNSFVAGDVLYGKLRPYLKKVVVADESGFCSTEIIPFNGFGKINPQYLMFCMTSPFMLSSVNQLTYGMDMPRLGTNDAKNLLIPLPPLAEQQAIVEKLSALLAEIDALENA